MAAFPTVFFILYASASAFNEPKTQPIIFYLNITVIAHTTLPPTRITHRAFSTFP